MNSALRRDKQSRAQYHHDPRPLRNPLESGVRVGNGTVPYGRICCILSWWQVTTTGHARIPSVLVSLPESLRVT